MKPADLVEPVTQGSTRHLAKLLRAVDDAHEGADAALRALAPRGGRAHVIGLTGNPGAGKSSVVNQLITLHRAAGRKVGVLAVDPTSPFSGGAILGDRIRMAEHTLDPGVFIRSLATRGALGGLSRTTLASIVVLDAAGYEVILVETVGVGQDEVDVARHAHTTIVVLTPGMGDDVQAMKAGILEIADVFCLNKADREGVEHAERDLQAMLHLKPQESGAWTPPVVRTVAVRGTGLDELARAAARHREHLQATDAGRRRERERLGAQLRATVLDRLAARVTHALPAELEAGLLDAVVRGEQSVFDAADALVAAALGRRV